MPKYSKKIYPIHQLREKVTIRVLPEKLQIYPRFKELVTKELGSDVCFVTTALWEAFLNAMDQVPPADEQLELKFMRQNVQINIGCQILYQPKKARRYPNHAEILKRFPEISPAEKPPPGFPFYIDVKKNRFLPLLLEEWGNMGERQKEFWRQRLIEQGIIPKKKPRKVRSDKGKKRTPPSVSTGAPGGTIQKILKLMEQSMTIVSLGLKKIWAVLKRMLGRK